MSAIYDIHYKYAPKNWNVVKYKFWQPSFLYTITINYDNKENTKGNIKDDIEITKDNFKISADFIPLHYTLYFGFDRFGPKFDLFLFPTLSSLIFTINTVVTYRRI